MDAGYESNPDDSLTRQALKLWEAFANSEKTTSSEYNHGKYEIHHIDLRLDNYTAHCMKLFLYPLEDYLLMTLETPIGKFILNKEEYQQCISLWNKKHYNMNQSDITYSDLIKLLT